MDIETGFYYVDPKESTLKCWDTKAFSIETCIRKNYNQYYQTT